MKATVQSLMVAAFAATLAIADVAHAQTIVWSENFDDGNGDNRWAADTGVWQIGSPTIGPLTNSSGYRTHSGQDCATTGLTANYPQLANSRLFRIQQFTVPSAGQFPRLKFWHWFNFPSPTGGGSDHGVVEVKVGTNAWQAVSPNFFYNGGDWTHASVDLSAFGGKTVSLGFHLVGQSFASAQGWYVDDITLETDTPAFTNPEGWENGIGDWSSDQGIWQVGVPNKAGGASTNALGFQTHGGSNCAVTLLNANYPSYPSSNARLVSPPFVLPPPPSSPFLRFWHWYSLGAATGGNPDYAAVEIRIGTNAWQTVSPLYSGSSGGWTEPFVDLTSFGGQTVQLGFHLIPGSFSGGRGWYVDDVHVFPNALTAANPYINVNLDSSGTNVITSWTWLPEYSGFNLESITNTSPSDWNYTNWTTVLPTPSVVSGENVETNPASGGQQYFRLRAN